MLTHLFLGRQLVVLLLPGVEEVPRNIFDQETDEHPDDGLVLVGAADGRLGQHALPGATEILELENPERQSGAPLTSEDSLSKKIC